MAEGWRGLGPQMGDVAGLERHAVSALRQNAEVGQDLPRTAQLAQAAISAVEHGAVLDQMNQRSGPRPPGRDD